MGRTAQNSAPECTRLWSMGQARGRKSPQPVSERGHDLHRGPYSFRECKTREGQKRTGLEGFVPELSHGSGTGRGATWRGAGSQDGGLLHVAAEATLRQPGGTPEEKEIVRGGTGGSQRPRPGRKSRRRTFLLGATGTLFNPELEGLYPRQN